MVEEGLWCERRRKIARIYQRRQRRPCYGEFIQIDDSPHDWFEEREPRCTLIVFVDDATSALMALRLAPAETTRAYDEKSIHEHVDNARFDLHSKYTSNLPPIIPE